MPNNSLARPETLMIQEAVRVHIVPVSRIIPVVLPGHSGTIRKARKQSTKYKAKRNKTKSPGTYPCRWKNPKDASSVTCDSITGSAVSRLYRSVQIETTFILPPSFVSCFALSLLRCVMCCFLWAVPRNPIPSSLQEKRLFVNKVSPLPTPYAIPCRLRNCSRSRLPGRLRKGENRSR